MANPKQEPAFATPLVDLAAQGIRDPVLRLRFLKFAAPVPERKQRGRMARFAAIPGLLAAVLAIAALARMGARARPLPAPAAARVEATPAAPRPIAASVDVWRVEDTGDCETYSNGLRIDNRFVVSNHARSYVVFAAGAPRSEGVRGTKPAGIVFHTTESQQAPFEAGHNRALKRIGESLLEFVQRKRAYHFLIDRFGRVFRIVAESDAANHAGYSVWADQTSVYVNLNESFLGVSFEAETLPGQVEASVTPAQIRSAAMLVEMLRSRYAIPATNCVTHAQVSVNPSNMRVGYHTDWSSSFPFEQVGLPNNYARASAAVGMFGFECDAAFLQRAGTQLYAGMEAGERQFREAARSAGQSATAWRQLMRRRYQERLAAVRRGVVQAEEDGA